MFYSSGRIQATSNSINSLKPIFTELQERREDYERLREKLDRFSVSGIVFKLLCLLGSIIFQFIF